MQNTYTTDTICPNCKCDVHQELLNHVYSEGGKDFEIECPSCLHMLSVAVEPIPSFSIAVMQAARQKDALDGLWDCANCDNRQIGSGFAECANCGTARQ